MIASEGGGAVVEEPGSTRSTAERDVSRNPTDHCDCACHRLNVASITADCPCGRGA